jgi:hypothetical protein
MPDFSIELGALLVFQLLGTTIFGKFEVETSVPRRLCKWLILSATTIALSLWIGHWALLFPLAVLILGMSVHLVYCRKNNIDPINATPRRRYYELRGWQWVE